MIEATVNPHFAVLDLSLHKELADVQRRCRWFLDEIK